MSFLDQQQFQMLGTLCNIWNPQRSLLFRRHARTVKCVALRSCSSCKYAKRGLLWTILGCLSIPLSTPDHVHYHRKHPLNCRTRKEQYLLNLNVASASFPGKLPKLKRWRRSLRFSDSLPRAFWDHHLFMWRDTKIVTPHKSVVSMLSV